MAKGRAGTLDGTFKDCKYIASKPRSANLPAYSLYHSPEPAIRSLQPLLKGAPFNMCDDHEITSLTFVAGIRINELHNWLLVLNDTRQAPSELNTYVTQDAIMACSAAENLTNGC